MVLTDEQKRSTVYGINPYVLHPSQRKKCEVAGCNNQCNPINTNKKTGKVFYRKVCNKHHNERTAAKHGLKNIAEVVAINAGFTSIAEYQLALAQEKGYDNYIDFKNSTHPYLKYRKSYCENIDGRLDFKCTSVIQISAQLQVDHIDGNPNNNSEENCQTLCSNCHIYKTHKYKDYLTPGRKAIKASKLKSIKVTEYNFE